MTVMQILERDFSDVLAEWDGWNYSVHGPMSLDDDSIIVHLTHQDGNKIEIRLPLGQP